MVKHNYPLYRVGKSVCLLACLLFKRKKGRAENGTVLTSFFFFFCNLHPRNAFPKQVFEKNRFAFRHQSFFIDFFFFFVSSNGYSRKARESTNSYKPSCFQNHRREVVLSILRRRGQRKRKGFGQSSSRRRLERRAAFFVAVWWSLVLLYNLKMLMGLNRFKIRLSLVYSLGFQEDVVDGIDGFFQVGLIMYVRVHP